jgi:hypothetical protein
MWANVICGDSKRFPGVAHPQKDMLIKRKKTPTGQQRKRDIMTNSPFFKLKSRLYLKPPSFISYRKETPLAMIPA